MNGVFQLSSPVTLNNTTAIGTAGAWVRDISLSTMGVAEGAIPAWATGVLFEVRNTGRGAGYDFAFGIQSADSADDALSVPQDNFITRVFVPLNATRTFDIYCGSLTSMVFKVVAYDNVVNHVTPIDLSPQVINGTEWNDAGVDGIDPGNLITVSSAPDGCKFALLEVRAPKGMKLYTEGHSTVANNGLHAAVSHVVLPLSTAKSFWMRTESYRAANGRTFPNGGLRFIGWIPERNYEYRPLAKRERSNTSQNNSWQLFPDSAFGLSMASFEQASGALTYGWALSATASGGEWWNREPKADMWFKPDDDGNVWIYRSQSSEQSNFFSAKLTGGFVNTPDGEITSVNGGAAVAAGATAVPVIGSGLAGATYAKLVLHAPSTHAHTTQALAVSGVTDTGLTIDAMTLGKMPYTDADHVIKLQILNSSNVVLAERVITLTPPAGYRLLKVLDADALVWAVLGVLKPAPARSQAVMPVAVTHGGSARAVEYELSAAGNWTGVVSLGAYQPTSSVALSGGTYRAGDATDSAGGWESLAFTMTPSGGAGATAILTEVGTSDEFLYDDVGVPYYGENLGTADSFVITVTGSSETISGPVSSVTSTGGTFDFSFNLLTSKFPFADVNHTHTFSLYAGATLLASRTVYPYIHPTLPIYPVAEGDVVRWGNSFFSDIPSVPANSQAAVPTIVQKPGSSPPEMYNTELYVEETIGNWRGKVRVVDYNFAEGTFLVNVLWLPGDGSANWSYLSKEISMNDDFILGNNPSGEAPGLADLMIKYLASFGYTGTINDMRRRWKEDNLVP